MYSATTKPSTPLLQGLDRNYEDTCSEHTRRLHDAFSNVSGTTLFTPQLAHCITRLARASPWLSSEIDELESVGLRACSKKTDQLYGTRSASIPMGRGLSESRGAVGVQSSSCGPRGWHLQIAVHNWPYHTRAQQAKPVPMLMRPRMLRRLLRLRLLL